LSRGAPTLARSLILVVALALSFVAVPSATPASATTTAEAAFVDRVNRARKAEGLGALVVNSDLAAVARGWSGYMAANNTLSHRPALGTEVSRSVTDDWARVGENVGYTTNKNKAGEIELVDRIHAAFMSSPGHRQNILGKYNQVGVGVVVAGNGTMWVTVNFMQAPVAAGQTSGTTAPQFGSWAAHPVVSGASAPAAVSWDGSRTDLFVVAGGQLRQRWQTSAGWGPSGGWHSLGRPSSTTLVGQPAVAAQRSGYLDVVARGADGQVWYRYYRAGKGWSGWSSLGGQITGGPAAVSWGVGHLAVVGWSPNGKLYVKSYDRGWSGWKAFSGQVTSAPGIASWGSGRLDVFARGADGSLHHYWFSGGRWGGPKSLGGQLAGGERPDAVAWGKNRLDVSVVGTNARVYRKSYSPSTSWTGFTGFPAVPGGFQPGTAVSSRRDGHLQLFVRTNGGVVWEASTR